MLEIILVSLTALYIYERDIIPHVRNIFMDVKPFNCVFCLSFWLGLALFTCHIFIKDYSGLIYLSLPLLYRVTQTKLLK